MERITSFCIDHDRLKKGLYLSRIDGDVVTYDMRMCVPNQGVYLENAGLNICLRLMYATVYIEIRSSMRDRWDAVPVSISYVGIVSASRK